MLTARRFWEPAASRLTPRRRKFMLKKVAIVGAAGLLTAAVLTQTKVGRYVSHQFDRADNYLESKIPPEEELRRIKEEVAAPATEDIDKAAGSVAEERYRGPRQLKGEVEAKRNQVENSRAVVEARGKMIRKRGAPNVKLVKWDGRQHRHGPRICSRHR